MSETQDFPDEIFRLARVAVAKGGLAAYRHVAQRRQEDPHFLRYLGPAFGTKFIYFVTKANTSAPSPIMDAVVQRWFQRHVPTVPLILEWSSPKSYERYIEQLAGWALQLSAQTNRSIAVDEVEHLIFADRATDEGSATWSEGWSPAVSEPLATELLGRLESVLGGKGLLAKAQPHLQALEQLVLDADQL